MKAIPCFRFLRPCAGAMFLAASLHSVAEPPALPPATFSHQGRLAVNGVLVNGDREFKFLMFHRTGSDPDFTDQAIWANFGVPEEVKEPEFSQTITVINGLYSIVLGDPEIMEPLPENFSLPEEGKLLLRIWVSGLEPNQFFELSPDQEITATPFALTARTVFDNAITSPKIADGEVQTPDLANSAVTGAKIADGAVDGGKLADGSIGGADLAAGSVMNVHLAGGAVTGNKIVDGTVTLPDLAANAVDGSRVLDASLGSADLATASVGGDEITDGAVATADLAPASVTGAKVAPNAINASHLVDSSIGAADLQPEAIQESALAPAAVTTDKLAEASITFSKFHPDAIVALSGGVPDGGVTTVKLANAAVTADKLGLEAVTAPAVAPGAVTGLDSPATGHSRVVQVLETGIVQVGEGTIEGGGLLAAEGESIVVGGSHSLEMFRSMVVGNGHDVLGIDCLVAGRDHDLFGTGCLVTGTLHDVSGEWNLVSGNHNEVTAVSSLVAGANNVVEGDTSIVIGTDCHVAFQADSSATFGIGSIASEPGSCVIGRYNDDLPISGLDPVFAVGDGDNDFNRRNTLVVGTGGTLAIGDVHDMGQNSIVHENGARLTAGGAWTNSSDRNLKENLQPVKPAEVLERVAALPIGEWNYKAEDDAVRHVGPMAQDFHAAFHLGDSEKAISTVDASGVALVAIQELKRQSDEQAAAIQARDRVIADLQARLERLEQQAPRSETP